MKIRRTAEGLVNVIDIIREVHGVSRAKATFWLKRYIKIREYKQDWPFPAEKLARHKTRHRGNAQGSYYTEESLAHLVAQEVPKDRGVVVPRPKKLALPAPVEEEGALLSPLSPLAVDTSAAQVDLFAPLLSPVFEELYGEQEQGSQQALDHDLLLSPVHN